MVFLLCVLLDFVEDTFCLMFLLCMLLVDADNDMSYGMLFADVCGVFLLHANGTSPQAVSASLTMEHD